MNKQMFELRAKLQKEYDTLKVDNQKLVADKDGCVPVVSRPLSVLHVLMDRLCACTMDDDTGDVAVCVQAQARAC